MPTPASFWGEKEAEFQIGVETTPGTLASTLKLFPVTAIPDVQPGAKSSEDAGSTARGTSERFTDEKFQGPQEPTISFEFVADDARLAVVLSSFFNGNTAIITPAGYSFAPYTSMTPAKTLSIVYAMKAASGSNSAWQGLGCTVKRLQLTSQRGGMLKCAVQCAVLNLTQAGPITAASQSWVGGRRLQHFDAALSIAGAAALDPSPYSIDITLENGATVEWFAAKTPALVACGQLAIGGSFALGTRGNGITQIANALTRTDQKLTFSWYTAATTGYLKLEFDAALKDAVTKPENNVFMTTFPFDYGKNATTTYVEVRTAATV